MILKSSLSRFVILTLARAISWMRKVIHIEQDSFQKGGAEVTFPILLAATEDMSYLRRS